MMNVMIKNKFQKNTSGKFRNKSTAETFVRSLCKG